jgi:DNA polymerase-3 subunit delta
MILVLYGSDRLTIQRRLRELKQAIDDGTGMAESNITELSDRNVTAGDILAAAMAMPFLAPRRLVLVTGLLDRFGVPEDSSAGTPRIAAIGPWQPLFERLREAMPATTDLVFVGGAYRRNEFIDKLRSNKAVTVEQHQSPRGQQLNRFIADEAEARGMHLDDPVIRLLAGVFDGDTQTLAGELDKLALFTLGRRATVADVEIICSVTSTSKLWDFTDAVLDGNFVKAFAAQRDLLATQSSVDALIAPLLGVIRTLGHIVDLLEEGKSPAEIGAATGQRYPALRDRAINRARRLGYDGIVQLYDLVVSIDRDRKRGIIHDDLALELLTGRLSSVGASR